MDFTPIIAQVWCTFGWVIPLMLLIGLLKSPWAKGHIGELLVRLFAHWQLDKQTYRRLHNVTLNTPDGTTQIDHVFLSPYGIFVLETKNMSGWIFGSEKQAQCYRDTNMMGGLHTSIGGRNVRRMRAVNQICLDDGRVVTYTEISPEIPFSDGWGDAKLICSISYEGDRFPYSRCTTKGYW